MTYRQLAQSVLASYAAGNMLKPTPLFEGSLDMPIFGNEDVADVAQWPTVVGGDKGLTISAGQLHGLAKGTKLLVLPSPAAANEEAIGVLEVASNDQLRSKLIPAADANGKTARRGRRAGRRLCAPRRNGLSVRAGCGKARPDEGRCGAARGDR